MALDCDPQQQEQSPILLDALPGAALAVVCRHLTTPSCPGPCRLAPVCKVWRHAGQQHLAGATVRVCFPEQDTAAKAQSPYMSAKNMYKQRAASLSIWLSKYRQQLAGFSLEFAEWPMGSWRDIPLQNLQQDDLLLRTAALAPVMASLVTAEAAAGHTGEGGDNSRAVQQLSTPAAPTTAPGLAAAAAAAEHAATMAGCRQQAVPTGPATLEARGGASGRVFGTATSTAAADTPPAAAAAQNMGMEVSAAAAGPGVGTGGPSGLQLRTLRLPLAHGRRLCELLPACPHLRALRLDGLREAEVIPPAVVSGLQHLTALHISGKGLGCWSYPMQLCLLPSSLEVLVLLGRGGFWPCEGLGHLTKLRQLRLGGLAPHDSPVDDEGAVAAAQQHLAGLKALTALECEAALTSNRALLQLPSLVAVGTLAGQQHDQIRDSAAALQCLQGKPNLRRLTLQEPMSHTPGALAALGQLTQLEELVLGGAGPSGAASRLPSSTWHDALGSLTRLQRLQAPLKLLVGEEGSDSPLAQLQQLRVVHAVTAHIFISYTPRMMYGSSARDPVVIRLAGALAQVKGLQEVHISGVVFSELLSVQAMVSEALPKVAVTVTTQGPGCPCVVEEVLG